MHQSIIDLEKSTFRRSYFDKKTQSFKEFVTHTDTLKPNIHLFRPRDAPYFYIVSDELKKAIETENIIGAKFVEANGWDGNDFFFDMVWDPNAE